MLDECKCHNTCKNDATGAAGLNSVKSSKQFTRVPKNFFLCSSDSSIKNNIEKIPLPVIIRLLKFHIDKFQIIHIKK